MVKRLRNILFGFAGSDDGNATVEFVLWLPLIVGIVVGAFDLNTVLLTQSNMWNVARDTARRVATGQLSPSEGQSYAQSQLGFMGFTYGVTITEGDDVVVSIETYLSNVSVIGVMGTTQSYHLSASVTMRNEES